MNGIYIGHGAASKRMLKRWKRARDEREKGKKIKLIPTFSLPFQIINMDIILQPFVRFWFHFIYSFPLYHHRHHQLVCLCAI